MASSHATLTREMGVSAPTPSVISVSQVRYWTVLVALVMGQKGCNGHLFTRCAAAVTHSPGSHSNTNIFYLFFGGKQDISEFHCDNGGFLWPTSKTVTVVNVGILASVRIFLSPPRDTSIGFARWLVIPDTIKLKQLAGNPFSGKE